MTKNSAGVIDWEKLAGELSGKVRPDTASKYFPKNPLRRALIARFMDSLADHLSCYGWQIMLDVGAGEGFVDHYVSLRFPGKKISGLEPDLEALEVARLINPGIDYKTGDGRETCRLPLIKCRSAI